MGCSSPKLPKNSQKSTGAHLMGFGLLQYPGGRLFWSYNLPARTTNTVTRSTSVRLDPMDISELKVELEKCHAASFGWSMSCCRRDRSEAEEVLQTVYLKILEGKAEYRGESSFKTWLFAVIHKTAVSEHRKSMLRKLTSMMSSTPAGETASYLDDQSTAIERSEEQKRFRWALAKLPGRQREVLHLVFYEDLTLREAAVVMSISIGSARQHYERGKKRLREFLEEMEVAYGIDWRRKENPRPVS